MAGASNVEGGGVTDKETGDPLTVDADNTAMDDPLDMLREWWGYEGDDVGDGIRGVLAYCNAMERRAMAMQKAMDAALPTIKAVGDSTVKRLWREAGYDTPKRGR